MQKNEAAIELLKSWRQGDEQEQQETLAYLKRVLDEDRFSDRKLFPPGSACSKKGRHTPGRDSGTY